MEDTTQADGAEASATETDSQTTGSSVTDAEEKAQTETGVDVNAIRFEMERGGSLDFVIGDCREIATPAGQPKRFVLTKEEQNLQDHDGDEFVIQTDAWVPAKGDHVHAERQTADVEPDELFAYKVAVDSEGKPV